MTTRTKMMPKATVAESLRAAGIKRVEKLGHNMAGVGKTLISVDARKGRFIAARFKGKKGEEYAHQIVETGSWEEILEFLK